MTHMEVLDVTSGEPFEGSEEDYMDNPPYLAPNYSDLLKKLEVM